MFDLRQINIRKEDGKELAKTQKIFQRLEIHSSRGSP